MLDCGGDDVRGQLNGVGQLGGALEQGWVRNCGV